MDGLWLAIAGAVTALLAFFAIFLILDSGKPAIEITCVTKGAQLHERDSKDGLYVDVWCMKGGKVVP